MTQNNANQSQSSGTSSDQQQSKSSHKNSKSSFQRKNKGNPHHKPTFKKTKKRLSPEERKIKKYLRAPGFDTKALNGKTGITTSSFLFQADIQEVLENTIKLTLKTDVASEAIEFEIPLHEYRNAKNGEKVEVFFDKTNPETKPSIAAARQLKAFDSIQTQYAQEKEVIGCFVAGAGNGYTVALGIEDINDLTEYDHMRAYVPKRQALLDRDIRLNPKLYGIKDTFVKKDGDLAHADLIGSRRHALTKRHKALLENTWAEAKVGTNVTGTIKNITQYGAFIDIGGIDGLLHQQDISWSGRARARDVLKIGQSIEVQIIETNKEEDRLKLGLKQLLPDPWTSVKSNLSVGNTVKGTIVSLADYGAFIEIDEGLEGLIHVSEIAWTTVKHPSHALEIGQSVEAKILDVDLENRRLALSLKALADNPYKELFDKHPIGTIVKGPITSIADFGAFIQLSENIEGLIHIGEMSWTERIEHPSSVLEIGQEVEVRIIEIDTERERVACSLKQVKDNPTDTWNKNFPRGSRHTLVVTQIIDSGAVVDLGIEGLTGLVKKRELSSDPVNRVIDIVKVGEELELEVLELNNRHQTLYLSARRVTESDTKEAYNTYKESEGSGKTTGMSLGDAMSQALGSVTPSDKSE